MIFSNSLIKWYLNNKRDLPWRNTHEPYLIWLSEIMLQQTRVAQGLPYYLAFTNAFPTVFDLANASEEQVLKLWQGLGYYSRARNLHATAQFIAYELKGKFPDNNKDLLKLKGIGDYTAAAIASFAFNEAVPVVDGNVFRVLSRYLNVETDISLASAKKDFAALAFELMPKNNPAIFNQAIMEFGALQCVPKNPNCEGCTFNSSCGALQMKKVQLLPFKSKKVKISHRYFNYLVLQDDDDNFIIEKRVQKDIWYNLYEFPLIESETEIDLDEIARLISDKYKSQYTIIAISDNNLNGQIHKLTHQHLNIKFWKIKINGVFNDGISLNKLVTFPFPIVIFNFMAKEYKI